MAPIPADLRVAKRQLSQVDLYAVPLQLAYYVGTYLPLNSKDIQ